MKVDCLYSYINPHNHPSVAVAKRLGGILDTSAVVPGDDVKAWRHDRPATLA